MTGTIFFCLLAVLSLTAISGIVAPDQSGAVQQDIPHQTAIFAGGCFWCMEPPFEHSAGVIDVTAGYTGGRTVNPSYEQVTSGETGHYEAVQVIYNPEQISYQQLLDIFWRQIDPTDDGGQFADRGTQYFTAIFYQNTEQRQQAELSKKALADSGKFAKPIITAVLSAQPFYRAEEFHQDYYKKNTGHYQRYKLGSGRDDFLKKKLERKRRRCNGPI